MWRCGRQGIMIRPSPALQGALFAAVVGCAVAAGSACGSGASGGSGGASSSSASPRWWLTCADPLCAAGQDGGLEDEGGVPCQPVDASCTMEGQRCGTHDPHVECGSIEICSTTDPRSGAPCPLVNRAVIGDVTVPR